MVTLFEAHQNTILFKMPMFRFPTSNPALLQKWESIVRKINETPNWKATRFTYVCSNHFPRQEYIIPPSQNGPCRIKIQLYPACSRHNIVITMASPGLYVRNWEVRVTYPPSQHCHQQT